MHFMLRWFCLHVNRMTVGQMLSQTGHTYCNASHCPTNSITRMPSAITHYPTSSITCLSLSFIAFPHLLNYLIAFHCHLLRYPNSPTAFIYHLSHHLTSSITHQSSAVAHLIFYPTSSIICLLVSLITPILPLLDCLQLLPSFTCLLTILPLFDCLQLQPITLFHYLLSAHSSIV